MPNRIGRLVAAVIAAVLTLLAAPVTESVALAPADSPSTYVYDSHHHPALVTGVVTERGPPATHDSTATDDDGLRSLGDLARPKGSTTPATYDYNDFCHLAQIARGCRLVEERADGGPAALAVVQRSGVATNTAGLGSRAAEVHGVLDPLAQTWRTTAVLGTREGTTVIGGGVRDLSPAQRALARDGDLLTRQPGAHAEVTVVNGARNAGLTPDEIVTTTNICPACQRFLEGTGATVTGPRSAGW